MVQETISLPVKKKIVLRRILSYALFTLPPLVLLFLFYILNSKKHIMDWVLTYISMPYRSAAAQLSSFGPFRYFSLAEILITLLIIWVLFFIVKTIAVLIKYKLGFFYLSCRLSVLIVVTLYIAAFYAWIWGVGYHSTTLAERTGLNSSIITVSQLTEVTALFAEKANELSSQVTRDANGHFNEDRQSYFELSKELYTNIAKEYPELSGGAYPAKPMIYSKLMSLGGFSGVYIALTGETNINIDVPNCFIPSTIAHEMAHQRGVNSEEEANYCGIAACITSNIPVYEYSGYLLGLSYLTDALNTTDPYACLLITSTFSANVIQDLSDNNDYWLKHETPASETAASVYDGYLKSNGIASGVNSYSACVDMLVSRFGEK